MPRPLTKIKCSPRVDFVQGADPNYVIWYIDQFPLDRLKLSPLEDDGYNVRRQALAEDIAARGLLNPLIVWNHTPPTVAPSPRPYFLHFGYNKLWALKHIGRTHARAFLTLDIGKAPEFPCQGCYSADSLLKHFRDGIMHVGHNGPLFKMVAQLDNWETPE
jgi:hypothetical protein